MCWPLIEFSQWFCNSNDWFAFNTIFNQKGLSWFTICLRLLKPRAEHANANTFIFVPKARTKIGAEPESFFVGINWKCKYTVKRLYTHDCNQMRSKTFGKSNQRKRKSKHIIYTDTHINIDWPELSGSFHWIPYYPANVGLQNLQPVQYAMHRSNFVFVAIVAVLIFELQWGYFNNALKFLSIFPP